MPNSAPTQTSLDRCVLPKLDIAGCINVPTAQRFSGQKKHPIVGDATVLSEFSDPHGESDDEQDDI